MSLVGLGKHRSRRIESAIAQALETSPEQLWPDRYPDKTK
jgi:lambda repressor-like predicted transcriptional regulator